LAEGRRQAVSRAADRVARRFGRRPGRWVINGVVYGLLIGLVGGLIIGLVPRLVNERTIPNEGIYRSARHAVTIGLAGGLIFGLLCSLIAGPVIGLGSGLFVALGCGLLFGGLACLQHLAIRVLLTVHDIAPWRYTRFLDEATELLFLRRAGNGYIFAHRLLLEYFAGLATTPALAEAARPMTVVGDRSQ
jgi:hypothetical protein